MRSQNEHGRWSPHRWNPSMWAGCTGFFLTVGYGGAPFHIVGFIGATVMCGLAILVTLTSQD